MSLESTKTSTVPNAKKRSISSTVRTVSRPASISNLHSPSYPYVQNQEQASPQRQAELFYMQKQIQTQTPMVLILEDGEVVEGCIEWYDRNVLKVRGRTKTLVYKAAIKYLYKLGDAGQ
jgi:sRNA-binding regulator protein Hfq